ncbi:MAG: hypothetical protein ABSF28_18825 [Terracidiphilus sp.]|jgi:hypothetical protein
MHTIAELNMLLHSRADLPKGLKLATEEFEDGWSFVRRVDARRLGKRIQTRGWNFIRIADESLRSGVGDTSQEAIASALKLALRRVSDHSNAVEVEHIELTQYPWFFLARVRVNPYRIQESSTLLEMPAGVSDSIPTHRQSLPDRRAKDLPLLGSAMPTLKQILVSSKNSAAKAA